MPEQRRLLQPRTHVDRIPDHEQAALPRPPHHHVTGVHADPERQPPTEQLPHLPLHPERSVQGLFRVVLMRRRRPERRHHRVTDELLDRPPALRLRRHGVIKTIEQRPDPFRILAPASSVDPTGFEVPPGKLDRFTSYYRAAPAGGLELVDAPDGQWSSTPAFPSGAGGLVSTADDWHAFARMLLVGGSIGDRPLLSPAAVRQMTTDQLTQSQRDASRLFLEGQGWGFGGSVDVEAIDPWNVPGRYGWVGGTGTAAHITPSTGAVTMLLSQLETAGPTPPALMRDFWRYAAAQR
jgi:hypothetical protein